jgi:hypothetical protein
MGIPKNTHLKACGEKDAERRFPRRNLKDYIFKILLLRNSEYECKLYSEKVL